MVLWMTSTSIRHLRSTYLVQHAACKSTQAISVEDEINIGHVEFRMGRKKALEEGVVATKLSTRCIAIDEVVFVVVLEC